MSVQVSNSINTDNTVKASIASNVSHANTHMQGRNRAGATKGETWEREGKKQRERNQERQRGELTV
jgi:hypothetical protein